MEVLPAAFRSAIELPLPFQDRLPRRRRIAPILLVASSALALGFVLAFAFQG